VEFRPECTEINFHRGRRDGRLCKRRDLSRGP
jgi:hypothetical protein